MRVLAILLLLIGFEAHAESCLQYAQAEISGKLTSEIFPGAPNFESVSSGDKAETYFFINLLNPVCIEQGNNEHEPYIRSIGKIQLVQTGNTTYKSLTELVGKSVKCNGSLFYHHTINHQTDVLMEKISCTAT